MNQGRLNKVQKEILKIYQKSSKIRRKKEFGFTREEIARLFFQRPEKKQTSPWRFLISGKESEIEKALKERRLLREVETEKQALARRFQKKPKTIDELREKLGLKPRSRRGIYSKKQDIFHRSLKDLVKKGYLEKPISGSRGRYQATEKGINVKFPGI